MSREDCTSNNCPMVDRSLIQNKQVLQHHSAPRKATLLSRAQLFPLFGTAHRANHAMLVFWAKQSSTIVVQTCIYCTPCAHLYLGSHVAVHSPTHTRTS